MFKQKINEDQELIQMDEIKESEVEQFAQEESQNPTSIEANYHAVLHELFPAARNNKDLVNFAYYLYKQGFVSEYKQDDEEWIGLRQRVNFCNRAQWRGETASMNQSILHQLYVVDLFSNDYEILWAKKDNLSQRMPNRCNDCKGNSNENFPFCPYFFAYLVIKTAEGYEISPEVIFDDLLGENKMEFRGRAANSINQEIQKDEISGINAQSAYGAYLLLASKMVVVHSIEDDIVQYAHIPLCRGDLKKSVISDMISIWKTGSGIACTLNTADKTSLLYSKTEGCQKCAYEQCPHKLAAYFVCLGKKYGIDPIDLSYHIATKNTYAGMKCDDNYQFDKYIRNIRKSPMKEESKAEFIKILHYIAGRKMNYSIPFLPFNLAISAPDREKAEEVVNDFCNAIWHFDYYRRGSDNTMRQELYMSSLSVAELLDTYKKAKPGTTFILHDVFILSKEDSGFSKVCYGFLKILEDRKEDVMSIIVGDKEEISTFFSIYPILHNKIFSKNLELMNMDCETVMEALEEKLSLTFTISQEVYQCIEQYIRATYPASLKKDMEYVEDVYEKLLFNHYNHDVNADSALRRSDIPYMKPPRSEQEIFEELNDFIGLTNVKQELQNVNDLVKFNIKMGSHNTNAINLHMLFTGNPGTGKTSVARLTAEILYSIGFIQENKLVVCSAKDLIGEYMGQTTPKTAKKCEQAYNGVLFIDEAYQLNPYVSNRVDEYREECIAELIQQMENNRDKLVIIFAGYTQEMEEFLNRANTGLSSRIGKTIHFPDYSSAELLEIFTKIVEKSGMTLGEGARTKALEIFDIAKKDSEHFGNARFARNLFERSLLQHAAITSNLDKDDPNLRILQRDEITIPKI